jgi:hypothetical protein
MMSHDYHSTQCAGCVFGIWRGGCSHPCVTPEDTKAAVLDDCPLHAAGHPRPHELNGGVCAVVTVASLHAAEVRASDAEAERDALRARAEAAEAALATARAEGAAAERADTVEWLRGGGAEALCCAGCIERGEHVVFLRDRDAYIAAATAHVRPVEGA